MIVAPALPPFPPNPTTGQWFQNFMWNGSTWVRAAAGSIRVVIQTFTVTGSYVPSMGMVSGEAECVGGGGGGGNVAALDPRYIVSGGGGGSGGRSLKAFDASLVAGGVVVTIGAAGGIGYNGLPGGTTSFGALCVANGGGGGDGNNGETVFGASGPGAVPGIGDVALPGAAGEIGALQIAVVSGDLQTNATGGLGGQIIGGNMAEDVGVGGYSNGVAAQPNTGAGGSGACINQSTLTNTTVAGGVGASGICWVKEYCWSPPEPIQPQPPGCAPIARGDPCVLPFGPWGDC